MATLQSAGAAGMAASSLAGIGGAVASGTAVVQEIVVRTTQGNTKPGNDAGNVTGSDELEDEDEETGSDEVIEGNKALLKHAKNNL